MIEIKLIEIFNKITKNDSEKNNRKTFQEWLDIKQITSNSIKTNENIEVVVLKVSTINFNLKSNLEQKAILNSYKLFLKNLNSEVQIVVSSQKTDVSKHLEEVLKNTKENPPIYEMSKDYIELINTIIQQKGAITKNFYIVIKSSSNVSNDILKITETLNACGNIVERCSKEETINLFKNFLNKRLMNIAINS